MRLEEEDPYSTEMALGENNRGDSQLGRKEQSVRKCLELGEHRGSLGAAEECIINYHIITLMYDNY